MWQFSVSKTNFISMFLHLSYIFGCNQKLWPKRRCSSHLNVCFQISSKPKKSSVFDKTIHIIVTWNHCRYGNVHHTKGQSIIWFVFCSAKPNCINISMRKKSLQLWVLKKFLAVITFDWFAVSGNLRNWSGKESRKKPLLKYVMSICHFFSKFFVLWFVLRWHTPCVFLVHRTNYNQTVLRICEFAFECLRFGMAVPHKSYGI